jgi:hypothetical protein
MKHLLPFNEQSLIKSMGMNDSDVNKLEIEKGKKGWNYKDFNDVKYVLENECSKFISRLKETTQSLIYRGVRLPRGFEYHNDVLGLVRKTVRKERQPSDLDPMVSGEVDNRFYRKFGIGLRSEGVFTSRSYDIARTYSFNAGDHSLNRPHIFFPIGDYKCFWGKKYRDLFGFINGSDWYEYVGNGDDVNVLEEILSGRGIDVGDMDHEEYEEVINKEHDAVYKKYNDFLDDIAYDYEECKDFSKVGEQEMCFICDEYYVVDSLYYTDVMEWLYDK